MNKNAKKWVAALRSGRYKQGNGCLHRKDDGINLYCCLGVACKLYRNEFGGKLKLKSYKTHRQIRYIYDNMDAYLPIVVLKWLGLRSHSGSYRASTLAADNDRGKPFTEIADIIENNQKTLFVSKGR